MEKKRMENKMQDSKREFFHKWDYTTDFEQGHTFNSYKDANKVWEYIASEISKAREEGRREVIHKLKEELDMAEVSKFIDAHQDFFNSFGESVLLKISELTNK